MTETMKYLWNTERNSSHIISEGKDKIKQIVEKCYGIRYLKENFQRYSLRIFFCNSASSDGTFE